MNGEAPGARRRLRGDGLRQPGGAALARWTGAGSTWASTGCGPSCPQDHPLRPYVHDGLVDNARAGELYRKARIGLNLYRATGGPPAESLNPRAYELAADGVFTVAQPRAEQTERFGGSVATFTTPGELEERIRIHLADAWRRRRTAEALPALVAEDTYHHRAAQLVAHLSLRPKEHAMPLYHGRDGAIYISTTAAGTASNLLTMTAWTMDRSTERVDVTNFDSTNQEELQGWPALRGTFEGYWNTDETKLFAGATSRQTGSRPSSTPPAGCPPSTCPAPPGWTPASRRGWTA